jgi:hypothetical protein
MNLDGRLRRLEGLVNIPAAPSEEDAAVTRLLEELEMLASRTDHAPVDPHAYRALLRRLASDCD